ncbi:MAG: TlpA family protein disulfide reductase [bacterium]|nr:TlpA family protein disulfide reductase [bacterium]
MKKIVTILTIFCVLMLFANTGMAVQVGDNAPQFEALTLTETTFDSAAMIGEKPLLLVFWATWCPVCKEEIPKLKEMYSTFAPQGLEVLAVNVGINDSAAKATRYVEKYDISYPVFFDEGSQITKQFEVQGTPTIIIVDVHGVVRYRSSEVPEDLAENFEMLMQ